MRIFENTVSTGVWRHICFFLVLLQSLSEASDVLYTDYKIHLKAEINQ